MKGKKKKSLIGRILKWTGITLLFLIIAIILIPIFFKDQLKDMALNEANKMLKADVALGDFDLTFFSTFPSLTLTFEDITITGRNEFEGIKLADIKQFDAHLGFWSVIGGSDIEVASIVLTEPKFDVRILQNGIANYDIVKSEQEIKEDFPDEDLDETPFNLRLNHYEIKNGYIRFEDEVSPMFAEIVNLNHEGNGDLAAAIIDFETITSMDELTYKMGGITYLSHVKTEMVMNLLMEFNENNSKFTFRENELSLNAVSLSFDGFYEMLEGYDDMDITLKADQTNFKDLLSLIPVFYQTGYEKMVAKGSLGINGMVKGKMDAQTLPAFEFGLNADNASINYPDAPSSIDNIKIRAGAKFPGGNNLDRLALDVSEFHADFVGNTIDADLTMRNPMTDPYMKSRIEANIDLTTLDQVIPLEEGQKYNGILKSDIHLDGRMSALEKEDYESFKAEGTLLLAGFHYESKDLPDGVDISEMSFVFSPKLLSLTNLEGKMGATDFKMNGGVDNYMGYIFRSEPLKGNFNYASRVLDLDALMPESTTEDTEKSEVEQVKSATEASVEPLLIPANLDFVMSAKVDKLLYDGMDIKNVKGGLIIRDETVELQNLTMNMLDGSVGLSGKYNTQNHKNPKVHFNYDLKDVDINQLSTNFITVEKLAPISKHAQGKVSSNFSMVSNVTPSFEPIYNTLTGEGTLSTSQVRITDYEPINRLAKVVDIDRIKNATFKNINARFAFENGLVHVRPFNVNIGNIRTEIEGTTSFEQKINYKLQMNIPKSEVPASVLSIAEKAVAKAQKIPGFKMKELPAVIPVNARVTNTVKDPKIETDFKEQLMSLGGDMKDAIKDFVDEKVEELKDTVKAVIDEKVEEVKDDLRERKEKIMNDAQKQADKIVSDANKLAQRTREEGDTNAQKLIDEAGNNPIKKRAAEEAAKRLREKAEQSAKKIEKEAKERADKIMADAQKQADRLE